MKAKQHIELNKAIEEAFKYGFKNRFSREKEIMHFAGDDTEISTADYAILKTLPVESVNGFKGELSYVVLDDGTLGILIEAEETKVPHSFADELKETENFEEESLVYHNDYFLF